MKVENWTRYKQKPNTIHTIDCKAMNEEIGVFIYEAIKPDPKSVF